MYNVDHHPIQLTSDPGNMFDNYHLFDFGCQLNRDHNNHKHKVFSFIPARGPRAIFFFQNMTYACILQGKTFLEKLLH